MVTVDNFLSDFTAMREHCDGLEYMGEVNPADGVFYPGISTDIPDAVRAEVEMKFADLVGRPMTFLHFMRLTLDGVEIPHGAHDDALMADVLLLIYLNRAEDCQGGTELVTHKETGMDSAPDSALQLEAWRRDTNTPEAWDAVDLAVMAPNRAVILPANRMHRAAAPNGFGDSSRNGRLVYSCFARYAA